MTVTEPRVTLGDLLKRARLDAHLEQTELATKIGRSPAVISKWERDLSIPNFTDMLAIIEATGADWLLTEPFRAQGSTRIAWMGAFAGQQADVVAA